MNVSGFKVRGVTLLFAAGCQGLVNSISRSFEPVASPAAGKLGAHADACDVGGYNPLNHAAAYLLSTFGGVLHLFPPIGPNIVMSSCSGNLAHSTNDTTRVKGTAPDALLRPFKSGPRDDVECDLFILGD